MSAGKWIEAEKESMKKQITVLTLCATLIELEANRFGLINAFTNAAQKLGPLQRIEMERFARTLLKAPLQ